MSTADGVTRRRFLTGALAGTALLAAGGLSACTGKSTSTASGTGPAGTPKRGGQLRVAATSAGQAETVNPNLAANQVDFMRLFSVFDGLYTVGPDSNPVPHLAESMTPNADASVWTIRLRSGVEFHNGKSLTADDLIYTIRQWAAPNSYQSYFAPAIIDYKSGIKKLDSRTVQVKLNHSIAQFDQMTAFYGFVVIQDGTTAAHFAAGKVAGTGPFTLDSFKVGSSSTHSRNPNYWGTPAYLDSLIINSAFTDEGARVNALLSGSADIVPNMSLALARANASNGQVRVTTADSDNYASLQCRLDQPRFKDPRVVEALRYAVDRQQIINSAFDGYGKLSNDVPMPLKKYFASDLPVREHDPAKAKGLLQQVGATEGTATLKTSAVLDGYIQAATLVSGQLSAVGFGNSVQRVDPSQYYSTSAGYPNKYEMFISSPGNESAVPCLTSFYLTDIWTKGPYNETGFGDGQDDALLFDAVRETDPAKAADKWHAVQQLQYDRGGSIILGNLQYVDGFAKTVHGADTTKAGSCNNYAFGKAWKA
jgi:peptide/nickel transport system substrate-binding protein